MSTSEWGGLIGDWTHLVETGENDLLDDQDRDDLLDELDQNQDQLEHESYAEGAMTIPGRSGPGANCGEYYPSEFCDECGEPKFGMSHCEQRSCPNCEQIWTRERAVGVTTRLGAARLDGDIWKDKRAVHAVMSPPEGEIKTLNQVYDGFREAYSLANEKGVRGGVAVFHGFRVKDWVVAEYEQEDPDMGIWKWLKEHRKENWRSLVYWSPHYHIIGLCEDFEANKPDEQDGWVAKRIRPLKPLTSADDEDGVEDMIKAVRYILGHATFETDSTKECVRWFGELAVSKFQPAEAIPEDELETLEETVEEVVGDGDDREQDSAALDEPDECNECGATSFSPIWDAGDALMDQAWVKRIGREQERRLAAAFEWAIGERKPPSGLKHPQTEEQAREAFEALL